MQLCHTEAFLLMELSGQLKPYVGQSEDVTTPALRKFGEPVVQKLIAHHGYDRLEAGALVLQSWKTLCAERGVPWRIRSSSAITRGLSGVPA